MNRTTDDIIEELKVDIVSELAQKALENRAWVANKIFYTLLTLNCRGAFEVKNYVLEFIDKVAKLPNDFYRINDRSNYNQSFTITDNCAILKSCNTNNINITIEYFGVPIDENGMPLVNEVVAIAVLASLRYELMRLIKSAKKTTNYALAEAKEERDIAYSSVRSIQNRANLHELKELYQINNRR